MPIPRFVLGFEKASADRHRPCENKRHGESSCSSQVSMCRYALRETTTDTISLLSSFSAVLFHWYCMLVLLLLVWMDFLIFYHASIPPASSPLLPEERACILLPDMVHIWQIAILPKNKRRTVIMRKPCDLWAEPAQRLQAQKLICSRHGASVLADVKDL